MRKIILFTQVSLDGFNGVVLLRYAASPALPLYVPARPGASRRTS